jgi:hypothetical protein
MSIEFGKGPWDRHGRLQWYVADRIPGLITKAARETGRSSNAEYIRAAIIEALVRDLGVDFDALAAEQPTKARNPIYADPTIYGASNSVEEVV